MSHRAIATLAWLLCTTSPVHAGEYQGGRNSSSPNYGWEFAEAPGILEGDWTQNDGLKLRVTKFWADHSGRLCNRRHTVKRENTWMIVCEEKDPTYGPRLWGLYVRLWDGDRWQFAESRPAPNLEALTSGNPDERTWFTYTKAKEPVQGATPSVQVQAPPPPPAASAPATAPSPQRQGDATFTAEELEKFKVDSSGPTPPSTPEAWWIEPLPGYERVEAGVEEGKATYICRTQVDGRWVAGKVFERNGSWCRIGHNGKERKRVPFEHMLQRKGDKPTLGWAELRAEDPVFTKNVMRFAYAPDGMTPICAVVIGDEVHPGHVVDGNACRIGHHGEERTETASFRLLIRPPKQ